MSQDAAIKTKILHATQNRMIKFGYHKVTMDEIAQDLGMSKNTIYKQFVSKQEITEALVKQLQQRIDDGLAHIEKTQSNPLVVFSESILFLRKELGPWFEHLFQDLPSELPHVWQDFLHYRNEKIMSIQSLVRKGIKQGVFRDVNDSIAVQAYLGAVKAIMNPKFLEQEKMSFHQALDAALDIWANGILRKGKK